MKTNEEQIYTVTEFNTLVDSYLGRLGVVAVEGEISQINLRKGRWIFAEIKDESSILKIFSSTDKITNFESLEEGMLVHVYGFPGLYKEHGRFQIRALRILLHGEGALKVAFEKLKLQLESEGLFAIGRKRPLPQLPEKIGVITSKEGKVLSDIIKTLSERTSGLAVSLLPVTVQGPNAVVEIRQAVEWFNLKMPELDLLIIARGGGSLEDLQAFNSEEVCRAIFSSKVPIVCGVGHERDVTLAAMVADVRASTPTNAAEIVARLREDVLRRVKKNVRSIELEILEKIRSEKQRVNYNITLLNSYFDKRFSQLSYLVDRFGKTFKNVLLEIKRGQEGVIVFVNSMRTALTSGLSTANLKVDNYQRLLTSFNPKNVLRRGYSITQNEKGEVVKKARDLQVKSKIDTTLFEGSVKAVVLKTNKEKK